MNIQTERTPFDPETWYPETDADTPQDMPPSPDNGGDEPPAESVEGLTYVAIEGVDPEDFSKEDAERLEVTIIEACLTQLGKPITDVRFIGEETNVLEVTDLADA